MNNNINPDKSKNESDLFGAGLFCGTLITFAIVGGAFVLSELMKSDESKAVKSKKTSNNLSDLIDEVLRGAQ